MLNALNSVPLYVTAAVALSGCAKPAFEKPEYPHSEQSPQCGAVLLHELQERKVVDDAGKINKDQFRTAQDAIRKALEKQGCVGSFQILDGDHKPTGIKISLDQPSKDNTHYISYRAPFPVFCSASWIDFNRKEEAICVDTFEKERKGRKLMKQKEERQ